MIACDTSSLVAFLQGDRQAPDVVKVRNALRAAQLVLPPATLTESLSNPRTAEHIRVLVSELPVLELSDGYWLRAAACRATLIGKKLKARLADSLIAQSCIDADISLITRDDDFRHFEKHCGLKLA